MIPFVETFSDWLAQGRGEAVDAFGTNKALGLLQK